MLIKTCKKCSADFHVRFPSLSRQKFCSNSCRVAFNNSVRPYKESTRQKVSAAASVRHKGEGNPNFSNARIPCRCKNCECEFSIWRHEMKGGKRKGIFCSLKCYRHAAKSAVDPVSARLYSIYSRNISKSVKKAKNRCKWTELVGYSIHDLRRHLEALFVKGMNWDNYGRNGWHIDHIKPISVFAISSYTDEAFKECWALSNIQPMWGDDNIRKGGINKKEIRIKYGIQDSVSR